MSFWSYIQGVIHVEVLSGNQPWKEYVVKDVLTHLPDVNSGHSKYDKSEGGLDIFINQSFSRWHSSCSHDDANIYAGYPGFNIVNKNRFATNGYRLTNFHSIEENDDYIITVSGSFRDTLFDDALKRFNNWLCRLSKDLWVTDICVKISGDSIRDGEYKERSYVITNAKSYNAMWDPEASSDSWKLKEDAEKEKELIEKQKNGEEPVV